MARPRNVDKYTPQAQKERLRFLVGDALGLLQKQLKKADASTLTTFIVKTLPLVMNEDTQTTSDVTLDLLAQKAVKVSLRIKNANEQNLTSEEIEEEETTSTEPETATTKDADETSDETEEENAAH